MPNILQCPGQPLTTKNYWTQKVNSAGAEKPTTGKINIAYKNVSIIKWKAWLQGPFGDLRMQTWHLDKDKQFIKGFLHYKQGKQTLGLLFSQVPLQTCWGNAQNQESGSCRKDIHNKFYFRSEKSKVITNNNWVLSELCVS